MNQHPSHPNPDNLQLLASRLMRALANLPQGQPINAATDIDELRGLQVRIQSLLDRSLPELPAGNDFTDSAARQAPHTEDSTQPGLRPSGIPVIGAVPWGTHFCEFYTTAQDLIETLVPYFSAGLTANDYCMWITSAPLHVDEAMAALQAAMPDLQVYLDRGQLEILDYTQWYIQDGTFDADRVLQGWSDRLAAARARGFNGLRLSGNTFWLEQKAWDDFTLYEEKINSIIGDQRMLALCTYSLEKCGVHEILDVLANHQFALIKTAGAWEIIQSAEHAEMEHALRESETRYHRLFTQMSEGFALHEIICDTAGNSIDYRFLDVNPAFERFTGLTREAVIGKTVLEVLPQTEKYWIETYGKVALTGEPARFQNLAAELGRYYDVMAFSPRRGQFAALFVDVTEQETLRDQARDNQAHIRLQQRLTGQREHERLTIAQELHDGPIQDLASATFTLQSLLLDVPDPKIALEIEKIRNLISTQISVLRSYAQELRPPVLAQFGLEKGIRAYIDNFEAKHPELEIEVITGIITEPDETVQHGLYRIFQEALVNIVRHSQASRVDINLNTDQGKMVLSIKDDGTGFLPPQNWLALTAEGHLGLVGMRDRAEMLGGSLTITSSPGAGTCVMAVVPLTAAGGEINPGGAA